MVAPVDENGDHLGQQKHQQSATRSKRAPLRALPLNISSHINGNNISSHINGNSQAGLKPPDVVAESVSSAESSKGGMQGALETRLGEMRRFMQSSDENESQQADTGTYQW